MNRPIRGHGARAGVHGWFFSAWRRHSCRRHGDRTADGHVTQSSQVRCHLRLHLFIFHPSPPTPPLVPSLSPSVPQVRLLFTPPGLAGLEDDSSFSAARLLFLFSASFAPPPPPPPSLPPFSLSRSLSLSRLLLVRSDIFTDELLPEEAETNGTDSDSLNTRTWTLWPKRRSDPNGSVPSSCVAGGSLSILNSSLLSSSEPSFPTHTHTDTQTHTLWSINTGQENTTTQTQLSYII